MLRKVLSVMFVTLCCLASAQIRFQSYVAGLSQPVAMIQDPGQANVQYVVQKGGIIRVIQNGALLMSNYVNLSTLVSTTSERGLLGLALPADYAKSGFAYVYYTDISGNIQIARYTRSAVNPLTLDTTTALKIIFQAHPGQSNHNGGNIAFGPDGYLYAGLGDGGSGNDPPNNSQNPNVLLGKIIRIDVNGDDFPGDPDTNYHIPSDNPFVDGVPITARGEIWDLGLRNPWRWCFDSIALGGTGALVIGDVGQDTWEEVDFEHMGTGGYNYGWRQREGAHTTGNGGTIAFLPQTDPIFEYNHNGGSRSITGGCVYRGSALGAFWQGRYFFAEEVTGQQWSFFLNQTGSGSAQNLIEHSSEVGSIGNVVSINQDAAGELYYCSFNNIIYKLVSAALNPTSLTIFRGIAQSGGLPEILQSDDNTINLRPGIVLSQNESPVTIRLSATAPAQTANNLRFFIEAQANTVGLTQVVEFWDYNANNWVQVDSRPASPNVDLRTMITPANVNRFIQQGTRTVQAQIRYFQSGPVATYPWLVKIDQAVWGFYP